MSLYRGVKCQMDPDVLYAEVCPLRGKLAENAEEAFNCAFSRYIPPCPFIIFSTYYVIRTLCVFLRICLLRIASHTRLLKTI